LSRQAVHARVEKGQLEAEQVEGVWRVPGTAVAKAVQAERRRFVGSGAVRILPVPPAAGDGNSDIAERVSALEAAIAELAENHRRRSPSAIGKSRCSRSAVNA
jgi:hypothetical protein